MINRKRNIIGRVFLMCSALALFIAGWAVGGNSVTNRFHITRTELGWWASADPLFYTIPWRISSDDKHAWVLACSGDTFGNGMKYGLLPDDTEFEFLVDRSLQVSDDLEHYCISAKKYVIYDGIIGQEFHHIGQLLMTRDGRHTYYVGMRNDGKIARLFIVIDEKVHSSNWVNLGPIVHSEDGSRIAFFGAYTDKYSMSLFINGKERMSNLYRGILLISPDERHIACSVVTSDRSSGRGPYKHAVYLDGKKLPGADERSRLSEPAGNSCKTLLFSPDSQHLLYSNADDTRFYLDGKPLSSYDVVSQPIFSPDSKRLAYLAGKKISVQPNSMRHNNMTYSLVLDGKELPTYDGLIRLPVQGSDKFRYNFKFTPDSKHICYAVRYNDGEYMLIEGKQPIKLVGYPSSDIFFSEDGKHYIVICGKIENRFSYKSFAITERGTLGESFDYIHHPIISPDGKHVAYIGENRLTNKWYLAIDGVITNVCDDRYLQRDNDSSTVESMKFDSNSTLHLIARKESYSSRGAYIAGMSFYRVDVAIE